MSKIDRRTGRADAEPEQSGGPPQPRTRDRSLGRRRPRLVRLRRPRISWPCQPVLVPPSHLRMREGDPVSQQWKVGAVFSVMMRVGLIRNGTVLPGLGLQPDRHSLEVVGACRALRPAWTRERVLS